MRRAGPAGAAFCLVFCAAMFLGGVARAEPSADEAERAERIFLEGRTSMKAHRYEEACAKFAQSQELDPASGTLLNLAACREAQGRTATAWAHYREGLLLSRKEANADGERLARERIAALEPVLCRLTLVPPESAPKGLVVTLDAVRMAPETLGNTVPVDPGTHVVGASAPQRKPWTERVSLVEQGAVRVVRVPPLDTAPVPVRQEPQPVRRDRPAESGGLPTETYVAGAVSVVGFAGTAYFGVRAKSEWDTRNEHCADGACDQEAVDASENATLFARLADAGAVVGVVGAGLAVYFALTATPTKTPAAAKAGASLRFDVRTANGGANVIVGGVF